MATAAAVRTAEELKRMGATEAWSEGTSVHARFGRLTVHLTNRFCPAEPGR